MRQICADELASYLSFGDHHGRAHSGCATGGTQFLESACFHHRRNPDVDPRDRRQHRHLQPSERARAARPAGARTLFAGVADAGHACDGRWGVFAADVPRGRRAAAEPVGADRLDVEQRHQRRNRRCPNPRQCFRGHGELLHRARDSARRRAVAHRCRRQRRHTALRADRGHRARVLAATLQSRSGGCRSHPSRRGHTLHDRRCCAVRLHGLRADA